VVGTSISTKTIHARVRTHAQPSPEVLQEELISEPGRR
jgi:hypothetical protein